MSNINSITPKHTNDWEITKSNRPSRPSPLSASLTLGWRAILKLRHVPTQLIDAIIFPILMTLMFTYVFGGALAGSIEAYLYSLIPGVLVMTICLSSSYTALGLNMDIAKGIFDRFRSLSFWRPAVLVGSLLGDTVRYLTTAVVVMLLGLVIGFRPDAGVSGVILALGIMLLFAFSLSWVWTALGLMMKDAESVQMMTQIVTFPLVFLSNVFVDPATTPDVLETLMNISPVSLTVTATRGLMHGTVTSLELVYVFVACALLIAIFAPMTMYLYNNKNTH